MDSKLGERLKKLREKSSMSKRQLARKIGVTVTTISRIEADGGYKPSIEIVAKIAEVFETSIDELVGRTVSTKGLEEELFELCEWAVQTEQQADLKGYFKWLATKSAIARRFGNTEGIDEMHRELFPGMSEQDWEQLTATIDAGLLLRIVRLPDRHKIKILKIISDSLDLIEATNTPAETGEGRSK